MASSAPPKHLNLSVCSVGPYQARIIMGQEPNNREVHNDPNWTRSCSPDDFYIATVALRIRRTRTLHRCKNDGDSSGQASRRIRYEPQQSSRGKCRASKAFRRGTVGAD